VHAGDRTRLGREDIEAVTMRTAPAHRLGAGGGLGRSDPQRRLRELGILLEDGAEPDSAWSD